MIHASYSKHQKYDIGHIANAEDFAYDCDKERITFRFYNALPQLQKLHRGRWKKVETKVRKKSQMDSLLIVCGGYSFKEVGRLNIPEYCFKIVGTAEIVFCTRTDNGWKLFVSIHEKLDFTFAQSTVVAYPVDHIIDFVRNILFIR